MSAPLTAADLEVGIANALRAHNMPAAAEMIQALARLDPAAAEVIVGAIRERRAIEAGKAAVFAVTSDPFYDSLAEVAVIAALAELARS